MRLSHGLGLRVSFCLQEVDDTLFEVALHDDFSIFGTSAYSTFTFQQFAQFFQIIVGAHETCDKSDDFATPVLAVQLYTQALLCRGEGSLLLIYVSYVLLLVIAPIIRRNYRIRNHV